MASAYRSVEVEVEEHQAVPSSVVLPEEACNLAEVQRITCQFKKQLNAKKN